MIAMQIRMGRAALGWGVRDLAKRAGISPNTVARIESGYDAKAATLNAIHDTFRNYGITFEISERGIGVHAIPDTSIRTDSGELILGSWPWQQKDGVEPLPPKQDRMKNYYIKPVYRMWDNVNPEQWDHPEDKE